jgi:hypothetical protein
MNESVTLSRCGFKPINGYILSRCKSDKQSKRKAAAAAKRGEDQSLS